MITYKNERVIWVDVDDTLVMHNWHVGHDNDNMVEVQDILDSKTVIKLLPNHNMIRLLKEESARGAFIVVHSRGGFKWATNVILALGIQEYVDIVMSKPVAYFDDKDAGHWLTDRVYLGPDVNYKTNTVTKENK